MSLGIPYLLGEKSHKDCEGNLACANPQMLVHSVGSATKNLGWKESEVFVFSKTQDQSVG